MHKTPRRLAEGPSLHSVCKYRTISNASWCWWYELVKFLSMWQVVMHYLFNRHLFTTSKKCFINIFLTSAGGSGDSTQVSEVYFPTIVSLFLLFPLSPSHHPSGCHTSKNIFCEWSLPRFPQQGLQTSGWMHQASDASEHCVSLAVVLLMWF